MVTAITSFHNVYVHTSGWKRKICWLCVISSGTTNHGELWNWKLHSRFSHLQGYLVTINWWQLKCTKEANNPLDRYPVAVVNITPVSTETVWHGPRWFSAICSTFLWRGGEICCTVIGSQRYSRDLPQGGLEIPCTLCFMGSGKELKKVKTYFKTTPFLSKGEKSMKMQPCTSKEVNELTLDANHSSSPPYSTEASPFDSDKPSVLPCER